MLSKNFLQLRMLHFYYIYCCIFWCTEVCNFDIIQFICFYFCYMCFWCHIQETIVTEFHVHGLGNPITLNHICKCLFLSSLFCFTGLVPIFMIVSLFLSWYLCNIFLKSESFRLFYLFTHLFILLTILATWSPFR